MLHLASMVYAIRFQFLRNDIAVEKKQQLEDVQIDFIFQPVGRRRPRKVNFVENIVSSETSERLFHYFSTVTDNFPK